MSDHGQAALGLRTQLDRHVPPHILHTRYRSRRRNTTPKRVKYQVVDGDGGGSALEGQNPRTAARSLRCSRGVLGGCPARQSPRCPALGAYPLLIGVLVPFSVISIGGYHPGCPSGALVDDFHPGMNFILADGFRASFVPPVARCPLRNSFSLTAPRPSLTYSSSRLDTVSRATRENSDVPDHVPDPPN